MNISIARRLCVASSVCAVSAALANPATPSPDVSLAQRYFAEAETLWAKDGRRLWGTSLQGPLLFVEPRTRKVVASQADKEGQLTRQGDVFVGRLPETVSAANRSVEWAGVRWVMVMWPLPSDPRDRAVLMVHESWHRVQDGLGLPMTNPANKHLDTLEGRLSIQLEWRALAAALRQQPSNRAGAVRDALLFRAARRRRFPGAAGEERSLEMHEGLAEYTGVKLSGMQADELHSYLAKRLTVEPARMSTFVRSFAYLSGPAYGILLDEAGARWRKALKPQQDLGEMLAQALSIDLPADHAKAAEEAATQYGGATLRATEQERDAAQKKRLAEYAARFVHGPVLSIPLQKMQFSFDPTNVQPLEGLGMVYPTLRISDVWGVLTANRGALLSADFTKVTVPAPTQLRTRPIKGDGWQLELKEGWEVRAGKRAGDCVLVRH
jgi:hypothetical protein